MIKKKFKVTKIREKINPKIHKYLDISNMTEK